MSKENEDGFYLDPLAEQDLAEEYQEEPKYTDPNQLELI